MDARVPRVRARVPTRAKGGIRPRSLCDRALPLPNKSSTDSLCFRARVSSRLRVHWRTVDVLSVQWSLLVATVRRWASGEQFVRSL